MFFKSNFPILSGHVWSCQMLRFLGIFVWLSSVHIGGFRRYFNPFWYSESIVPNILEFVSISIFFHPCYLGFVTSFKNTNLFVKFMERVWQKKSRKKLVENWLGNHYCTKILLELANLVLMKIYYMVVARHDLTCNIKRFMTDVPFGMLLFGGLDSFLVVTMASWHLNNTETANV